MASPDRYSRVMVSSSSPAARAARASLTVTARDADRRLGEREDLRRHNELLRIPGRVLAGCETERVADRHVQWSDRRLRAAEGEGRTLPSLSYRDRRIADCAAGGAADRLQGCGPGTTATRHAIASAGCVTVPGCAWSH